MVYIHIPFCKSFCTYCGFYSEIAGNRCETVFRRYSDSLLQEISSRSGEILAAASPRTLYIGGGTPSVFPLPLLREIVAALRSVRAAEASEGLQNRVPESLQDRVPAGSDIPEYEEFTIEVNPDDIVRLGPGYVEELAGMGVNRVSMGVQSFDDGILRWMNRRHDAAAAVEAFRILRGAGIGNISLDIITGIPSLSDSVLESTLDTLAGLRPEHVSAYQLSVEDGSALDLLAREGKFTEAPEELCREQYEMVCSKLREAGYRHYEISNFALEGREAVHNSAYWKRVPYVGLGAGAHSFDGKRRSWNSETVPRYSRTEELLSGEDARVEEIMLSLRTAEGMPRDRLFELCEADTVNRLLDEGALVNVPGACAESRTRIPEERFFVSDSIISELL